MGYFDYWRERAAVIKSGDTLFVTVNFVRHTCDPLLPVLTSSPSRDGDVAVYVFQINKPSLLNLFLKNSVLVSAFMVLSTVFYFINSPNNSPLSHSVLPVLILPYWSFQPYVSFMKVSLSPDIILCRWPGLKHQVTNNPKFLDVEIWAYLEISCLVPVFKVTPLSMHPLGQPFKPRDHGARPRWPGYVRNHAFEEGSSIFETASPSTADSL